MSKISREDTIKSINTIIFSAMVAKEGKNAPLHMTQDELISACKKSISDMQKLEKIEEALNNIGDIQEAQEADLILFAFGMAQILRGDEW